ncbi:Fungalysin metallopeptidase-domain-containing protein, partial [Geranomyces variabilis]
VANLVHDLGIAYGFGEKAGNFQNINSSGAGKGADAVNVVVGTDTFVASFSTPPDGQAPRFTFGTVSADMLIHELGQGILQRLTGGPSNAGCLIENEAGGMGEGLHGHFPHKGQCASSMALKTIWPLPHRPHRQKPSTPLQRRRANMEIGAGPHGFAQKSSSALFCC